ncbi:MAG: alpha-glucan family phosphorylase [Dehalococcoidales bacterium]|nr:alpha-glucan family phosphorylase [Dehalococcoidales bacterium]
MSIQPLQSSIVAYFSMEIGLTASMPTYSGGLGILAGDSLRAAADIGIPLVAVTLLHRKGYFRQHLDADGNQRESPAEWNPEDHLEPLSVRVTVTIEGRKVWIRPWRYVLPSPIADDIPVLFLDTALPENNEFDRTLTDQLYGGDEHYRLCQEVVLGMGGLAILRALGYTDVTVYHMNEGHSALLTMALLSKEAEQSALPVNALENIERVRDQCVFTTHTPVPAGFDKFPFDLVKEVLGDEMTHKLMSIECLQDDVLNMTYLALFFSRYINGVSMRHEEISSTMFPGYPINSITNGVHALTWTSEPFQRLYDRHVPQWRQDNLYLRYVVSLPIQEVHQAHLEAKQDLISEVKRRTGVSLSPSVMTLGFARRMTAYKRADLLLSNLERLKRIAREAGPLQIVYAGKAHPRDEGGKALIRRVFQVAKQLSGTVPLVFLEEYDLSLAKYICAGVDLWLNTPLKPDEASGTSGMKAAFNGVPSLSVLDGWWVEGHFEGVTGWSIGQPSPEVSTIKEADSLYDKLENVIVPMFYRQPNAFDEVRRSAIAINASYYNSKRMMLQYLEHAYMPSY